MADMFKSEFNLSGLDASLNGLLGSLRESLARRMLVSGGLVLRNEAQANALRTDKPEYPYNEVSRGSHARGTLADAMYLVFDAEQSVNFNYAYTISWNDKKAWWGKLREFGYVTQYVFYFNKKLNKYVTKGKAFPLKSPITVPARPFLAPAFDSHIHQAKAAMIERGREELPKLLGELTK